MEITIHQVMAKVREIAEADPGHVYARQGPTNGPACLYVHGDEPGCIFGAAFMALGVPAGHLRAFQDFRGDTSIYTVLTSGLFGPYDFMTEGRALEWCRSVQREQDNGKTWGNAWFFADRSTVTL